MPFSLTERDGILRPHVLTILVESLDTSFAIRIVRPISQSEVSNPLDDRARSRIRKEG